MGERDLMICCETVLPETQAAGSNLTV